MIGTGDQMTLWPASVFSSMRPGDLIHVDFDGALLQVMDVEPTTTAGPRPSCSTAAG